MNEYEKQDLIEWLRNEINLIQSAQDEIPFGLDYDGEMALKGVKIALASLEAEPVGWLTWHSIPPSYQEPDRGGEYLAVHEHPGETSDDGSVAFPVYRKPEVPC